MFRTKTQERENAVAANDAAIERANKMLERMQQCMKELNKAAQGNGTGPRCREACEGLAEGD